MSKAIYAGTFDPFTLGHGDIVNQALKVFDEVVIAIGVNPSKQRVFNRTETERYIARSIVLHQPDPQRITIRFFDDALVHFAEREAATAIVRGIRQVSDFADEFTQHGINSRSTELPIVYFIAAAEFLHVSSSSAKQMAQYGLDTHWLIDPHVRLALDAKLKDRP